MAETRDDIQSAMDAIKIGWGASRPRSKPLADLAEFLDPKERVVAMAITTRGAAFGWAVLTTDQVLNVDKVAGAQSRFRVAPLAEVTDVTMSSGSTFCTVIVTTPFTRLELTKIPTYQAKDFYRAVYTAHQAYSRPSATASTPDPAEQLTKLAQLHDAGIVTREEFELKKAEILRRM